jgi:hypothetical protein
MHKQNNQIITVVDYTYSSHNFELCNMCRLESAILNKVISQRKSMLTSEKKGQLILPQQFSWLVSPKKNLVDRSEAKWGKEIYTYGVHNWSKWRELSFTCCF